MREIVLDTETTGLDPARGDRVVEIGCVELMNHIPTGKNYHVYINPERDMPEGAFKVHGLSEEFLREHPKFIEHANSFLDFIGDSTLIIHNAPFDMGFLNFEYEKLRRGQIKNPVIDTVQLARKVHPGARVSLDAMCKHYGIDNTKRTLHGALLDSEILAEVYLELIGGRQVGLALSLEAQQAAEGTRAERPVYGARTASLPSRLTDKGAKAHKAFIAELGENAIWSKYSDQ